MQTLTLKQKIAQMFITGFENLEPDGVFYELLKSGLGGVIFFTRNIESREQFKNLITKLSKKSEIPLFFSIDQEGGRVERTENIHKGKKYLSARYAYEKGLSFLRKQTEETALELKDYGINMNFAPVLDVNTNPDNPIIGERAFSNKPEEVIEASKIVLSGYKKHGIITVCKHFPGHGAASGDSHKTLPVIDLSAEELKKIHIKPFKEAVLRGAPAVMAAHVLYPELDSENPASVSEKIISGILIKELGFKGVIITDDMEMNGIKGFTRLEACVKAVNAGVNMFIFRDSSNDIINLISDLERAVKDKIIPEDKINNSVNKILNLKRLYGLGCKGNA